MISHRYSKSRAAHGRPVKFLKSAAEELPPAAQQLGQIAHTQAGAGTAAHGEAPEISGRPAIGLISMLDLLQGGQVLLVVRLHGNRPADMLQGRHLIAHALIGQSAEIVPPGVPVGAIVQRIDGLLIAAIADILDCSRRRGHSPPAGRCAGSDRWGRNTSPDF